MAAALPSNTLECSICLSNFMTPKFLPCGHTFCLMCVEQTIGDKIETFPCPLCGKDVTIPEGGAMMFPTNFVAQRPDTTQDKTQEAKQYCSKHKKREVEFFCLRCKTLVCLKCFARKHNGHENIDIEREKAKEKAEKLVSTSEEFIKIIMARRKTAKKPVTNKFWDKIQSQTERENDTNSGSEEEMETATSYRSAFTRSPHMIRHRSSYMPSPGLTSNYSTYTRYSGKNQSVLSNTSSTGSDLENLASSAYKSTDRSLQSSPHQTRQAIKEFRLFDNLPKHESSQSAGNETFESSPLPSPPKDVKVDKDVSQDSMNIPFNLIIAVLFGCWLLIFPQTSEASFNQFEKFVQNIDNFKSQFPAQENRFWRTVKASGKHVLNVTSPDYPAILLFVTKSKPANDDQFDVGSCIARKISAEFNSANMVRTSGSPIVDVGKLTTGSPQKQKMEFDDQLRRFLESNYKSVIVEHLELLTPAAALLLHGYCDNDNAPYKDVMIILVLYVENDNINPRAAEALLKQSWERELETDKVDALMSRVANNIVIVHPESIASSSQCD